MGTSRPGPAGPPGPLGWVLLAWVLGLAVAALAYAVGPDRLIAVAADAVGSLGSAVSRVARLLGALTVDLVRGLAVGAFATFVLLCLVALRRGLRARAALGVVAFLWCLLVAGVVSDESQERWSAALLLAGVGALVVTRRILLNAGSMAPDRRPPRQRPPDQSWPDQR